MNTFACPIYKNQPGLAPPSLGEFVNVKIEYQNS